MSATHNDGRIYWADGDTQNAILASDYEEAAVILGCHSSDEVNSCEKGEMEAYGVAMKDDIFQAPKGLAN